MSGSPPNHLTDSRLLSQLQRQCQDRHGNLTTFPTTPSPESSTGEQGEAEDTDFGAVMYIAAVLVFYSLGIVVMIVKYLKTERKELEEEMALESFFKGIPSKKMEHNRDAVNRVAIRAFHTLTTGAKRQDQLLVAADRNKQTTPDGDPGGSAVQEPKSGTSPHSEDSDSSRDERSPYLLQREPSKYLPRVSLIFRDNRANDRRRTYDNIRSKGGLSLVDKSLPSGQRSPSLASSPVQENGQPRLCLRVPGEQSDCSDGSVASPANSCRKASDHTGVHKARADSKGRRSQNATVKFVDEKKPRAKPPTSRNRAKTRAKNLKSASNGPPRPKPAIRFSVAVDSKHEDHPTSSTCPDPVVRKAASGSMMGNGSVSPGDCPSAGSPVTVSGEQGDVVPTAVSQHAGQRNVQPSGGLLVSDV